MTKAIKRKSFEKLMREYFSLISSIKRKERGILVTPPNFQSMTYQDTK